MAQVATKGETVETNSAFDAFKAFPARVKEYVQDLVAEMRRVTWPSRQQVYATTAVVLITVAIFSAYFWAVDFVLGQGVTSLFQRFTVK